MFVQVINLDRSPDRLAKIGADLDQTGWHWQRLAAIAPKQGYIHATPLYARDRARHLFGRDLSRGEVGCFLSHLAALRAFVAGDDAVALVLEDDAKVDPSARQQVEQIAQVIGTYDADWACVNLCFVQPLRRRQIATLANNTLYRAYQFPLLTGALLWHKNGAQRFVAWCDQVGIHAPIDNQLRDWIARGNRGYACERPVVGIRDFPTTITERQVLGGEDQQPLPQNKFSRHEMRQKLPLYWRSFWRHLLRL